MKKAFTSAEINKEKKLKCNSCFYSKGPFMGGWKVLKHGGCFCKKDVRLRTCHT